LELQELFSDGFDDDTEEAGFDVSGEDSGEESTVVLFFATEPPPNFV
jgi:hypothetical protein